MMNPEVFPRAVFHLLRNIQFLTARDPLLPESKTPRPGLPGRAYCGVKCLSL
jgi:hypothetical protein